MNHAKRPDLSRPMITMDGPSSPSREQRSAQRIAQDAGNAFCAGDADCNVGTDLSPRPGCMSTADSLWAVMDAL